MQDIVVTLVFMMALLIFAVFPALKITEFVAKKYTISAKIQNFLTLVFTVVLALGAAIYMKIG